MAIYSLHRSAIRKGRRRCRASGCLAATGKALPTCEICGGAGSFVRHRPGFAAAHARYILRPDACSEAVAVLPPLVEATRADVSRWLLYAERFDRKNARICDRIMVALPIELSAHAERVALVRAFCDALTDRKVPYVGAVHDMEGDADNPHAHIIVRDRAFATHRPVLGLGDLGSMEWIREVWEREANRALDAIGVYERIDRRSFMDLGITDRKPGTHVGPVRRAA